MFHVPVVSFGAFSSFGSQRLCVAFFRLDLWFIGQLLVPGDILAFLSSFMYLKVTVACRRGQLVWLSWHFLSYYCMHLSSLFFFFPFCFSCLSLKFSVLLNVP